MAKFVALLNRLFLSVPLVIKDESGKIIENRTLSFIRGTKVGGKVKPAYFNTNNLDEEKALRAYPGNSANGGTSFQELIVAAKAVAPAAPAAPVAPVIPIAPVTPVAPVAPVEPPAAATPAAPAAPAAPVVEATVAPVVPIAPAAEPGNTNPEEHIYPDVKTNQAAFAVLKTYDAKLKQAEHRNKETLLATAALLGVSFPNL